MSHRKCIVKFLSSLIFYATHIPYDAIIHFGMLFFMIVSVF